MPPAPLLISYDPEHIRKQAAVSTQRFEEGNSYVYLVSDVSPMTLIHHIPLFSILNHLVLKLKLLEMNTFVYLITICTNGWRQDFDLGPLHTQIPQWTTSYKRQAVREINLFNIVFNLYLHMFIGLLLTQDPILLSDWTVQENRYQSWMGFLWQLRMISIAILIPQMVLISMFIYKSWL